MLKIYFKSGRRITFDNIDEYMFKAVKLKLNEELKLNEAQGKRIITIDNNIIFLNNIEMIEYLEHEISAQYIIDHT